MKKQFMSTMKSIYRILLSAFALFVFSGVKAQIIVTPNQSARQLVDKLVGSNVVVLNPVLNCPSAHNGVFSTVSSNLNLPGGIILATGNANEVSGPHSLSMGTTSQGGSDPDLSALVGEKTTNNACVLEFDFVPDVDTASPLSFSYVFGSEEYPEYACTQFNDVFGFFLSGRNYTPKVNIALIPGSGIPVAINSINNGTPGSAGGVLSNCTSMGPGSPFTNYYVDNQAQNGQTISLDGFTTVLQASAIVYPCDTYHLKLAVANVSDMGFQSAVFLQENSFTVDKAEIKFSGVVFEDEERPYLVEGCPPATIIFERERPLPSTKKVCLDYRGTAINGVDYDWLPSSINILPNKTIETLSIKPIQDFIEEPGYETIIIRRLNCCTLEPIDSFELLIRDSLKVKLLSKDTIICGRDTVTLHVTGEPTLNFHWEPSENLSNPFDTLIKDFPSNTTVYTVTASYPGCPSVVKSFTAGVEPVPIVSIYPNDTSFCISEPYRIQVDVQPDTFENYNFTWAPNTGLNDPFARNPDFFLEEAGDYTYVLAVQTPLGCLGKDTVYLTTWPATHMTDVTENFTAKYGDEVQLNAQGALYYVWTPDKLLNFPNQGNPVVTALDTATFRVIGTNYWGCRDTAYVKMDIDFTMTEFIPNAFTPNNDGINDVFSIKNMNFQRLIEFRIFNRWGQEIFSTTDARQGWDGTYKGVPQESGIYKYLIRINTPDGKQKMYKGDISLLR